MDDKLNRDELLMREEDILRGLLEAAEDTESSPVEIARKGKVLFRFSIRPLSERDYTECRDKATKYVRNKQLGIKLPEDTDTTRFRSLLIYRATDEADRAKLWDNQTAWERLDVLSGPDLIDRVLLAGEKAALVARIDQISGFGADLEDTAKN